MTKNTLFTIAVIPAVLLGWWVINGFQYNVPNDSQSDIVDNETPAVSRLATATPVKTPVATAKPTAAPATDGQVLLNVPFMAQAPTGNWSDPRQQDGCEEASVLMAMHWVNGTSPGTAAQAEQAIIAMADWEEEQYGNYHDTNARDTVERLFKGYSRYSQAVARYGITVEDIKAELTAGKLVIVPANGRMLGNPNYTPPGPLYHMLVVKGYDPKTNQFITNDPGTRKGAGYRYTAATLFNAINDYPTGNHLPITTTTKAMIVVSR